MAYNEANLSKIANAKPASGQLHERQIWHYEAGADSVAAAAAAGYFNNARELLKVGDRIHVVGASGVTLGFLAVTAAPASGDVTVSTLNLAGSVARGQATTVDENDTIVTGLGALACVVVQLDDDPVDGCMHATASIGNQSGAPAAGSFLLKTWKSTDGDATLVAATTFGKKVNWIAFE